MKTKLDNLERNRKIGEKMKDKTKVKIVLILLMAILITMGITTQGNPPTEWIVISLMLSILGLFMLSN